MLGLKRGITELMQHEKEWEKNAAATIAVLKGIFNKAALDIQHVGSTSVARIKAKPIIDIAFAVDNLDDLHTYMPTLKAAGFIHKPENDTPRKVYFRCVNETEDKTTHHIHIVKAQSREWDSFIDFRDRLNTCQKVAEMYEALKMELAYRFPRDREAYTYAKSDFIRSELKKAFAERKEITNIEIKQAESSNVRPAFDLALKVFEKYELPEYGTEALTNFKAECIYNPEYAQNYKSRRNLMFVALDGEKTVGVVCEKGNGHVSMMFVDGDYHRRGIATVLLREMADALKKQDYPAITLNASPYGLPFYRRYGFEETAEVQTKNGFVFTPMIYRF